MSYSAKVLTNEWHSDELSDYMSDNSPLKEYARLTDIEFDSLVDFNTSRLIAKQRRGAVCLTALSAEDTVGALGYFEGDTALSEAIGNTVSFGRCFCNDDIDDASLDLLSRAIDEVCTEQSASVCRIKCDGSTPLRRYLELQGFVYYYSTVKYIYHQGLQPRLDIAPPIDACVERTDADDMSFEILIAHQTTERYNHPYLPSASLAEYYREWWKRKINHTDTLIFRAVDSNGDMLAMAVCSKPQYMQEITNIPLYIVDFLYTAPSFRRMGIGAWFLSSILNRLSPATIETSCSVENGSIRRLLERVGFRQGEDFDYFAKRYNRAIPAIP